MEQDKIFIDMDGVLCDFETAFFAQKAVGILYPQSQKGFFLDLRPIEEAIEAFHLLSERFDTYILSTPSVKNPYCYIEKRLWVEKYLGMEMVDKLILSVRKDHFTGKVLIDDRPDLNGGFNGEFIHFGSDKFPDWDSVLGYLLFS